MVILISVMVFANQILESSVASKENVSRAGVSAIPSEQNMLDDTSKDSDVSFLKLDNQNTDVVKPKDDFEYIKN